MGYILGYSWPSPQALQIASAWWLSIVFCVWLGSLWLSRALRSRGRLIVALFAPLAATFFLGAWISSLLMYGFGGWHHDEVCSGIRCLFDGPAYYAWHGGATWLLEIVGLPSSFRPVDFVNGTSVSDRHGSLIFLGLFNEAALAWLLATIAALGISVAISRLIRSPANPALQAAAQTTGRA